MQNFYDILGVTPTASDQEIKSAYKKLAMQYHPDRNPGDQRAEEKFKEINAAYEVLKDSARRQEYDLGQRGPRPGAGFGHGPGGFHEDIFEDIFRQHFGRGRQTRNHKNTDVRVNYVISLEDAFKGREADVTYIVPGEGRKTAKIRIPPGIDEGVKIRYAGAGSTKFPELAPGDLYVEISIAKHPRFQRKQHDLYVHQTIDAIDAMIGCEVQLLTIEGGMINVKIPPSVQNQQMIRLKGKGMNNNGQRGDMFVVVDVKIPKKLSEEQLMLLRKVKALSGPGMAV